MGEDVRGQDMADVEGEADIEAEADLVEGEADVKGKARYTRLTLGHTNAMDQKVSSEHTRDMAWWYIRDVAWHEREGSGTQETLRPGKSA